MLNTIQNNRIVMLLFLFLTITLSVPALGEEESSFSKESDYLDKQSAKYQKIVDVYFPGWRIPTRKDKKWDWDDFSLKWEPPHAFVALDINGDERTDFACICIKENKDDLIGKLILLEGSDKGNYHPVILEDEIQGPQRDFLEYYSHDDRGQLLNIRSSSRPGKGKKLKKKGSFKGWYEERIYSPKKMRGDGLRFGTYEASDNLIYWDGKKYKWLSVSD